MKSTSGTLFALPILYWQNQHTPSLQPNLAGPPSPREGAIPNFGAIDVEKRIYRSSFPYSCNIEHLKSLQLKTIVTLVSTAFDPDVDKWLASSNVQRFRIVIPAHKSSEDAIPIEKFAAVMSLMMDDTKRPILIHCNKGKHRTGCMTAGFRKLHGMDDVHAITEYHEYARPKARAYDVASISRLNIDEILRAVFNLQTPMEPVTIVDLQYVSRRLEEKALELDSIGKEGKTGVTSGEGSRTPDDSDASNLPLRRFSARRRITASDPPLSPPFSTAVGLGVSVPELMQALMRIGDGGDVVAITPPQTPADEYDSDLSLSSGDESC